MRKSKTRCWDSIWEYLDSVTQLGWPIRTHEPLRDALVDQLEAIRIMSPNTELAHLISDAVLTAYRIGARTQPGDRRAPDIDISKMRAPKIGAIL